MKRVPLLTSIALAACSLFFALLPPAAATQGTHKGVFYTKADVERTIKRVEESSDAFRKVVDRSLDRSVLNGTNREDNINQQVKELENAIDKLRKHFDRAQTWEETRSQVQHVNEADEVNAIVRRSRWRRGGPVRAEWALVRADLTSWLVSTIFDCWSHKPGWKREAEVGQRHMLLLPPALAVCRLIFKIRGS